LVQFEVRAQLHVFDAFVGEQAKQPGMRIAIFDRVGFYA
jgi:hypothetical protein